MSFQGLELVSRQSSNQILLGPDSLSVLSVAQGSTQSIYTIPSVVGGARIAFLDGPQVFTGQIIVQNSVGISITPAVQFHMYNPATNARARIETGSSGAVAAIQLKNTATTHEIGIETATDAGGGGYPGTASSLNIYVAGAFPIVFSTTDTERVRIAADGTAMFFGSLFIGPTVARAVAGDTPIVQIEGLTGNTSALSLIRDSNGAGSSPTLYLAKSRAVALGGVTVVQADDALGDIIWAGADGTNLVAAARIGVFVDGTPGTNDMPGRLVFYTTPDGSATPVARMSIANTGIITFTRTAAAGAGNFMNLNNTTATVGAAIVCYDNGTPKNYFGTTAAMNGGTDLDSAVAGATGIGIKFFVNNSATASVAINTSGQLLASAGTNGAPGNSWTGDPDTGFYSSASGQISFTSNATQVWTWDGDLSPVGAGTRSIGTSSNYINELNYKVLTDRGCLGCFDEGVEMPDGKTYSDLQALCMIQKHPGKKTIYNKPMLDYKTFPIVSYKKASIKGVELERDEDGEPIGGSDGIEMTSMFSIFIGAFKEIDKRLAALEKAA